MLQAEDIGLFHRASVLAGSKRFTIVHSDPSDHIFRGLTRTERFYESELLEALAATLCPGDLVVDVGANIGNHSVFFAGVCGCEVVAVEPFHQALELLRINLRENGLEELVHVVPYALGSAPGRGSMYCDCAVHNLGAARLCLSPGEVPVTTLDGLSLSKQPRLIKVDVEGLDLDVLKGGVSILSNGPPTICVEAASAPAFNAIADLLVGFGLIPTASHNFTATHIFRPVASGGERAIAAALGRSLGLQYIRHMELEGMLTRQLRSLSDKISELEDRLNDGNGYSGVSPT